MNPSPNGSPSIEDCQTAPPLGDRAATHSRAYRIGTESPCSWDTRHWFRDNCSNRHPKVLTCNGKRFQEQTLALSMQDAHIRSVGPTAAGDKRLAPPSTCKEPASAPPNDEDCVVGGVLDGAAGAAVIGRATATASA